jgi:hypothetical protein
MVVRVHCKNHEPGVPTGPVGTPGLICGMMSGGTTAGTDGATADGPAGRAVGANFRRWACVSGVALILGSPFAGGRAGSKPSRISMYSVNETIAGM